MAEEKVEEQSGELRTVKQREYDLQCLKAWNKYKRVHKIAVKVPDAIYPFQGMKKPPKPTDYKSIANYGLPKKERKFPYYTDEYVDRIMAQEGSEVYTNFVLQEQDRRMNGFFFYNGDKLEWITGHHYMTLQYWKIPIPDKKTNRMRRGKPFFIDAQRDLWYALSEMRNDKHCYGLMIVGYRRFAKTVTALAEGYWDATENTESVFPIQSKTLEDSEKVFKKLTESWELLPPFLKPVDDGSTKQARKLIFDYPKERNVSITERINRPALKSKIYPVSSTTVNVDGDYVSYFFKDEFAKGEKNVDVNEVWSVVKPTLMVGSMPVGKAVLTSTVEDSENFGSASAKVLWEDSDFTRKNGEETISGLVQFFLPAYYGYIGESAGEVFVDEWGYSNCAAAKRYHEDKMSRLEGDKLMSYMRKFPLNIHHAWVAKDMENTFDFMRLTQQDQFLRDLPKELTPIRGNFEWKNGIRDSEVIWRPNENGRWLKVLDPMPEDRGKWQYRGTQRFPSREQFFTGIDPFSHQTTVRHGSNGAIVTIMKNHPADVRKEVVACVYNYRPKGGPNELAEDVIKQIVYYSSPTLAERNTFGLIQAIQARGYQGFMLKNPLEKDPRKLATQDFGISTTPIENREQIVSMVGSFIMDNIGYFEEEERYGYLYYHEINKQLMEFNVLKWTKYDLVVALGLAIVAMRGQREIKAARFTAADWFGSGAKNIFIGQ